MNRLDTIAQAYSQAPWRKQLRIVGLFTLTLVFVALVAGIYVILSANITTVGRDIESKNNDIDEIDWQIEEMESQLARIKSNNAMMERAKDLGFQPVASEELIYLPVPGFSDKEPARLAPDSAPAVPGAVVVPARYTESIFDWLRRETGWFPTSLAEVLW